MKAPKEKGNASAKQAYPHASTTDANAEMASRTKEQF
jgi:hypothetical protein